MSSSYDYTEETQEQKTLEDGLDQKCIETFNRYPKYEGFMPLFPNVLVRILPKTSMSANLGIIIPDTEKSNKPTYEGIVLRTWAPFDRVINMAPGLNRVRRMESDLKPGDHVVFPHYAGMPLPGLSESKYRSVPEGVFDPVTGFRKMADNSQGVILGRIEYPRQSTQEIFNVCVDSVNSRLQKPDSDFDTVITSSDADILFEHLKENFELIPKIVQSRTISGK